MTTPLNGLRIVELGALGPAPFAASVLADMGADVVRIDRPLAADLGIKVPSKIDMYNRNKRSVALDLKSPEAVELVLEMVEKADILIEGFRPGVAERLGLGPEICLQRNPRLIYGRMTGWGQSGPMAQVPGHDINYLALTGALQAIGEQGREPVPPLNLVADLGGGAMYLVAGILAAVIESKTSGKGQVVDAAMIDGVVNLMTAFFGFRQENMWSLERGDNFVDGGAPFYRTYETSDGKYVAVGAIESRFYQDLLKGLELDNEVLPSQNDRAGWPQLEQIFASRFKTKTRDEWVNTMASLEACFSPVLDMDEAQQDPHMKAREVFTDFNGITHPSPAPRFQRTPASLRYEPPESGQHSRAVLSEWGFDETAIERYLESGVVVQY